MRGAVMMGFLGCILYMAIWGLLCFPLGRLLAKMRLRPERAPFKSLPFEEEGKLYERLGVRAWKDILPDVSQVLPMIVPRKKLSAALMSAAYMRVMLKETCVAETTHWILCAAGLPMLWIWPGPGGVILTAVYILVGNLSFIMIQRYNRPRYQRLLTAAEERERRRMNAGSDTVQQ